MLRSETTALLTRRRIQALLVTLALMPTLAVIIVRVLGSDAGAISVLPYADRLDRSGWAGGALALSMVASFIPLMVAVLTSEALAQTRTSGQWRHARLTGAHSLALLLAKLGAVVLVIGLTAAAAALVATAVASATFGAGLPGIVGPTSAPKLVAHYAGAVLLVGVASMTATALGLLASSLAPRPLAAAGLTLVLLSVAQLLRWTPPIDVVLFALVADAQEGVRRILEPGQSLSWLGALLARQLGWGTALLLLANRLLNRVDEWG